MVALELPELVVVDAVAWRAWLGGHHDESAGVWLVLAKKGTVEPTSLTYDQALEEALCHGWIDGQVRRRDETTYRQRFTRRRPRSAWSKRKIEIAGTAAVRGSDESSRRCRAGASESRRLIGGRLRRSGQHPAAARPRRRDRQGLDPTSSTSRVEAGSPYAPLDRARSEGSASSSVSSLFH
jgi:hypothetical protein